MLIEAVVADFLHGVLEPARERLVRFAEDAASDQDCQISLTPADFASPTRVEHLQIGTYSLPSRRGILTTRAWFDDGTRWVNGKLTIPTGRLPASVHTALVGRRVGEVAEGAVLDGLRIAAAEGAGPSTRVYLDADLVPFAPDGIPVRPLDRATHRTIVFDTVREISRIADHVVRVMEPDRARHALAWLADAGPGDQLDCGLCWSRIATCGMPAHLEDAVHLWKGTTGSGRTILKNVCGRIIAQATLVPETWPNAMRIGEWRVTCARDHGSRLSPAELLGIPLDGLPVLHRTDGTGGASGEAQYLVSPDRHLAALVHHTLSR